MIISYRIRALAAFVALGIAAPLHAETLGSLSFTFDGATSQWLTRSAEVRGKMRHSAKLEKGGLYDQVEVTGYPEDPVNRERLTLSMVFAHGITSSQKTDYSRPTDTSLLRLLGAMTGPRWEARDIAISYTLSESSETEATLSGSFEATFCYHEEIYADAKADSCQPGSGKFETRLVIEVDE